MNWLIFVVVTVITDSLRIFLDNYISDVYFKGRGSTSQKIFHGAFQIIFALIVLPLVGIDVATVGWANIFAFFASGFISSLAGIPYYKALELDDSTNIGIFMQLSPVLYLVLGWLFLGETITPVQLVAFIIILSAPLLILAATNKRSQKIKLRAIVYAFVNVLLAVVANLIFVKANNGGLNFLAEMALFYLGKGVSSFLFVATRKKWRRRFGDIMSQHPRKLSRLFFANAALCLVADATYRLSLAAAPSVAIASAVSDSVEPIVIFFMGLVLTLISPKFGREELSKKSILVHLLATILIVIGVVLIQA